MSGKRWWQLVFAVPVALVVACGSPTVADNPPTDDKRTDDPPPSEGMVVPTTPSDSIQADEA